MSRSRFAKSAERIEGEILIMGKQRPFSVSISSCSAPPRRLAHRMHQAGRACRPRSGRPDSRQSLCRFSDRGSAAPPPGPRWAYLYIYIIPSQEKDCNDNDRGEG